MKQRHRPDLKAIARDAMKSYGFAPRFPDQVIRESENISGRIFPDNVTEAADLRHLLWSSIDNFDSKDLDQIEFCEEKDGGIINVKVAIADVDCYVPKDSATDRYAAYNTTAVYTGVETFFMIPFKLCGNISSLLPGKDCQAVVAEYDILPDGDIEHVGVYRAVVSNKAKLIYEEVGNWIEKKGSIPDDVGSIPGLKDQILLQHKASLRLRKFRMQNGALDLETAEARPVMRGNDVSDIISMKQNEAHRIIEEFMVAANRTFAGFLMDAGVPMTHRVVKIPEKWDLICEVVAGYGVTLPDSPDSKALTEFLAGQRVSDPKTFPDLSLTIVKLLGHGEYVPYNPGDAPVGHFALAVPDYTHSTAPNRRYNDLIIQRIVKSVLDGKKVPYTPGELERLSVRMTDRDKASQKVERFMLKSAAAVLLSKSIGKVFDAIVTGASGRGTYVRIYDPPVEGRVMEGYEGLYVGRKVKVSLLMTDAYRGYIDFECLRKGRR
ncbi:RNB domain-containing ribonuclease [Methanoplanus endosymbiosus]|uniref:RNB domain-containing ribonuclease n=2 Tax=Methanoplanus endosymbiosus TaxID=33865 RepID=A0A9E7PRJ2_9EURY|nr:RNB domain-containing ribonuclease [Methanoplanus endosymbiosus]